MSFKGLTKSVVRAPQQFRQRFNIGDHTKDGVYTDAERRFQDMETETRRLHDESKKYFDSINGMLQHQIEFSKAMTEIYKPITGRPSDPDSLELQINLDGVQACEEYEAIVKDLQETLQPELEMIESRVIRPANELIDVIKAIQKTVTKREHKKLDYDRRRASLKKLQDKKDRTAKDEKAMWKAETDVEQATQDFNYYNDVLKDELPKLFALERDFIQPLFQSFYYMQLNIFYTLHERMQRCDIGYFDLTLDIEEAFHAKRGNIQEQVEALGIVRFKTVPQRRPPKPPRPAALEAASRPMITAGPSSAGKSPTVTSPAATSPAVPAHPSLKASSASVSTPVTPRFPYQAQSKEQMAGQPGKETEAGLLAPPPPYSPPTSTSAVSPVSPDLAAIAAKKSKPPPPKSKPARLGGTTPVPQVETVTALYDYSAQAEGDLSFRAGDVIEIVTRTQNDNEWWTGRLQGKEGQFPGNYVRLG